MSSTNIWISNDVSTFQVARTPTKIRHVNMGQIHEDSIGRIVLPVSEKEMMKTATNRELLKC
ncbi:CPS_collapsed_G0026380.mRNA.1.CDS.1 [Saccharomyces cerevisiae]|nr:CPS_collapsed_G0026380.mRNA.1.CDS.1 [Saccharomyces cerevisiae]